jgi:3-oxoacyl-[acyl-carrier protein] reductase
VDLGLTDRVVLVTGAGGGVGPTLAATFATEGARVALHVRDASVPGRAHDVAERVRAGGRRATVVGADLRSTDAIETMVGTVAEELGAITILVNATSAFRTESLADIGDDGWSGMLDDMLGAAFRTTRAVVPGMQAAGWGRIVSFGSRSGLVGVGRAAHYAAAKAGIIGLTAALAKELGPDGILVNAVAPTQILTDRDGAPSIPDERAAKLASTIPLRRLATPEDVAPLVVWLASAANTYVTGQTITFSGGAQS